MKINEQRFKTLKKVIESGYCSEAKIQSLKIEDMLKICANIKEISDLVALQKAIAEKRLIAFLAGDEPEGEKK